MKEYLKSLESYYVILLLVSINNLLIGSDIIAWIILGINLLPYFLLLCIYAYYRSNDFGYYISKEYDKIKQKIHHWTNHPAMKTVKFFWKDHSYRILWIHINILRKDYPKGEYRFNIVDGNSCLTNY